MISIARLLGKISDYSYLVGKYLLISTMLGITCFVLLQVFFRYVLNHALIWPEELSRWLLVWTGYLGASVAFKLHQHVALSVVVSKLPPKLKHVIIFIGRLTD